MKINVLAPVVTMLSGMNISPKEECLKNIENCNAKCLNESVSPFTNECWLIGSDVPTLMAYTCQCMSKYLHDKYPKIIRNDSSELMCFKKMNSLTSVGASVTSCAYDPDMTDITISHAYNFKGQLKYYVSEAYENSDIAKRVEVDIDDVCEAKRQWCLNLSCKNPVFKDCKPHNRMLLPQMLLPDMEMVDYSCQCQREANSPDQLSNTISSNEKKESHALLVSMGVMGFVFVVMILAMLSVKRSNDGYNRI